MSLTLRWVGESELDRVAETRLRCYATGASQIDHIKEQLSADGRAVAGDYLLAEDAGEAVGTATSLSMTMWIRGCAFACQGVAWVGTIKTRRRTGRANDPGIASQVMRCTLERARERGQVLSSLMPFRCSFYEHFGYGIVEKRNRWIVPTSILPRGDGSSLRFRRAGDEAAIQACRQACVEAGHCDLERSEAGWRLAFAGAATGFEVVDQPVAGGPIEGYLFFQVEKHEERSVVRIYESMSRSPAAFARQLHFLHGLRDQHSAAIFMLPTDLPLNHLLKESQIPHRPVEHATPRLEPQTRMQVRVLDHKRLLEGMSWPAEVRGSAVIAVEESEGNRSTFRLEVADGRAAVTNASSEPDLVCRDHVWASVVLGHLSASDARHWGLLSGRDSAAGLLDACSRGGAAFCTEYF